jgi:hypothetical protein
MKSAIILCPLLIIAGLLLSCKHASKGNPSLEELSDMRQVVERQIQNQSRRIADQLAAFSKIVAADRDFSMKLLVENNRSAPEVTDFAQRYMEPMDFSLLEIADSQHILLSCAQFPASAGSSVAEKATLLPDVATFINDNVKGQKTLTLQAQLRFKILDSVMYCSGGETVDEDFISKLVVAEGFKIVLKQGQTLLGSGAGKYVVSATDSSITLNDTTYAATSLPLPFAGLGDRPVLLLINGKTPLQKSK